MIFFVVFVLLFSIFLPRPSFGVYEEYYYYKNCQKRELLKLGKEVSQKFTIDKDFGAIEVYFERERVGKGEIEFVLKTTDGKVIYKNIYPLEKVIHGYFFPFGFERVKVNQPQEFIFSIKLLKNPSKAKLYVCKDSKGKLSFKISGERGLFESLRFWITYNIRQDPWFFGAYFGLLLILILFFKKS